MAITYLKYLKTSKYYSYVVGTSYKDPHFKFHANPTVSDLEVLKNINYQLTQLTHVTNKYQCCDDLDFSLVLNNAESMQSLMILTAMVDPV